MKFSILVPVYNVERYLEQCIESVLSQNYSDYELILTNDGSADGSPLICERYAKQDPRIRYFSKQNEGLLLTRRYAIKRAQGEYVLFLDSDDYWEPNLLETVAAELDKQPIDMLLFRFNRVRDDGRLIYADQGVFADHALFTRENKAEFMEVFVASSRLNTLWSKCVKRSIMDIDYDYGMFADKKGEDLLQSMNLLKNADTILYLDKALYDYRLSPTGRGRNFKKKYINDFEAVRAYVLSILMEMNVPKAVFDAFYSNYYRGMIRYFRRYAAVCPDYWDYKQTLAAALEMPVFKKVMEQIPFDSLSGPDLKEYAMVKKRQFLWIYCKYRLSLKLRNMIKMVIT